MRGFTQTRTTGLATLLACACSAGVHGAILTNGGFELGLAGWRPFWRGRSDRRIAVIVIRCERQDGG